MDHKAGTNPDYPTKRAFREAVSQGVDIWTFPTQTWWPDETYVGYLKGLPDKVEVIISNHRKTWQATVHRSKSGKLVIR